MIRFDKDMLLRTAFCIARTSLVSYHIPRAATMTDYDLVADSHWTKQRPCILEQTSSIRSPMRRRPPSLQADPRYSSGSIPMRLVLHALRSLRPISTLVTRINPVFRVVEHKTTVIRWLDGGSAMF